MYKVQCIGKRNQDLAYYISHDLSEYCEVEKISTPEEISEDADICLASGVYYLIKSEYLNKPILGVWGFHESKLPKGRGNSPLQWTVLNGENELWVSFFQLVEGMDEGDLLGQEGCSINNVEGLRPKSLILIRKLINRYLLRFLNGKMSPYPQEGTPTYYKKRTPKDSELDLNKSLRELWPLIRICDNELYPAWFEIYGEKFKLKRYHYED
jgi:methionyl-tRNA formyltransferase